MADDAGIDFMLPIGRWKGYGGDTNFHGSTLGDRDLGGGLCLPRRRAHHACSAPCMPPLFNPIIAAKEFVTVDHIGEGRFGINLVVGWNEGEFEMFGVNQRDHDDRYDYAQEWLDVIKRAWTDHDDFDFEGRYLNCKGVRAFPKPYGDTRPIIMNAGRSGIGQSFALKNCDAFFTATVDSRHSVEANAKKVDEIKSAAAAIGREIDVYTVGQVVCRPTQKEADDYYHYAQVDNADWGAIEQMMALKNVTRQTVTPEVYRAAAAVLRDEGDRRLSVRRLAGPRRRGARQHQPRRHARHRGVVRELSQRGAVFLRRGAAAPRRGSASGSSEEPGDAPLALGGALFIALSVATSFAQDAYPSRLVKIVLPNARGLDHRHPGAADGRPAQPEMGQARHRRERPGRRHGDRPDAGVPRRAGRLHAVLSRPPSPLTIMKLLYRDLPFEPSQFTPIALLVRVPNALAARKDFPAANVKELIDYAKAHPGKMTFKKYVGN